MIRVVIADDHHLVRQGIRLLLERPGDIAVVGEADDGARAIELVERLIPDVLVIDLAMPNLNGLQAVDRISRLDLPTHTVILSMHVDETLVRQAVQAGAKGYVAKDSVTDNLLDAVRAASRGRSYLSPSVETREMEAMRVPGADMAKGSDLLTAREQEVLVLVATGLTNNEIAQRMNLSVKTVEKHRAHLMTKLGVRDLASLIRHAIKYGLISLDE